MGSLYKAILGAPLGAVKFGVWSTNMTPMSRHTACRLVLLCLMAVLAVCLSLAGTIPEALSFAEGKTCWQFRSRVFHCWLVTMGDKGAKQSLTPTCTATFFTPSAGAS